MTEQLPVARRTVLAAGMATVAAAAVTACGDADPGRSPAATAPATSAGGSAGPTPSGQPSGLIAAADVPVGGSASATGPDGGSVLVAQPEGGQFVAFDATCTHQGCTVLPDGAQLRCPCHGSVYDAFTGEVQAGPAPAPLAPVPVTVKAGQVVTT